jgi:hypothetical protein
MQEARMPDPDPISRLQFARSEIDRVFGEGYAAAHPEVIAAVMISAAIDYHAQLVAGAVAGVAAALADEEQPLVPVRRGLLR